MTVSRPDPFPDVTAYLAVAGATAAIDWYRTVLGGELIGEPVIIDDGRVGHAELLFGSSVVMLADEFPDHGVRGPAGLGGTSVSLVLQVEDPDAVYEAAIGAGATRIRPVADTPHGTRSGWFFDPFGHRWNVTRPRR